ncbi:MAG: response regulator [Proteobacteria bacterium]|nr:response regulator [Pseudomonadota bacterium]MBU1709240.1 response regulator [Pseudomonadota bacterium]
MNKILYIDDEKINLTNFTQTFNRDYEIFTAINGEKALDILEQIGEVSLVITDQRMPGMSGVEVLYAIKELYPDTSRMVITAYTDVDYLVDAINRGHVYQYIFKPWNEVELRIKVKHAVDKYILTKRNQKLLAWLEKMNTELEDRVIERTKELNTTNTLLKLSNNELREAHTTVREQAEKLEKSNHELKWKLKELEKTKEEVKSLQDLLPICSYCKKIRDDDHYWEEVESYIRRFNNELEFSHSICPDCYEKHIVPELAVFAEEQKKQKKTGKNVIEMHREEED